MSSVGGSRLGWIDHGDGVAGWTCQQCSKGPGNVALALQTGEVSKYMSPVLHTCNDRGVRGDWHYKLYISICL